MHTWVLTGLAGIALYALVVPSRAAEGPPPGALTLAVTDAGAPAAAGAVAPFLRPAPDGSVLMSWIEPSADGQKALRWSRLREGRWTPASTIVIAADFFANWADVPSIVQLSDGRLAAHWLRKSGASTYAYHVAVSLSADGGTTWSAPFAPHTDRSDTEHGFVSMFERADGALGLVWLDGRLMATAAPAGATTAPGGGHGMDHGPGGAMTLRATTIGRDGTPAPDVALDERVCECCPTTAAVTSRGVVVAYRDRGATEVRDIGVARFDGRAWSRPALVHADKWAIEACPVNGPSLSARGERVALAWFTAEGNRPRVSVAFSSDAGGTFGAPVAISDAAAVGRVDAELLEDGSALVAWMEHDPAVSSLRVKRAWPDGRVTTSFVVTPLSSGRGSGYPRMAVQGGTLVFAWTEPATTSRPSVIRTATAPVPR
jgi:hypothetical protein